jgi:hypothetical protein
MTRRDDACLRLVQATRLLFRSRHIKALLGLAEKNSRSGSARDIRGRAPPGELGLSFHRRDLQHVG